MLTWIVAALVFVVLLSVGVLWRGLRIHNELVAVEYACHKAWADLQGLLERRNDEGGIAGAIELYNAAAVRYNRRIGRVPDRLVARYMGCRERELYGDGRVREEG